MSEVNYSTVEILQIMAESAEKNAGPVSAKSYVCVWRGMQGSCGTNRQEGEMMARGNSVKGKGKCIVSEQQVVRRTGKGCCQLLKKPCVWTISVVLRILVQ